MSHQSYKESSKRNWGKEESSIFSLDEITVGCLQRMADATELMAKNYAAILRERDEAIAAIEGYKRSREHLKRRIYALRGVITRLKRRP